MEFWKRDATLQSLALVIFTDADDLWHPSRVERYLDASRIVKDQIDSGHPNFVGRTFTGIAIKQTARESDPKELPKDRWPKTAVEVDQLISGGVIDIYLAEEYHTLAVPESVLRTFLDSAPRQVLEHRYCDRYLVNYTAGIPKARFATIVVDQPWLYYYRFREHTASAKSSSELNYLRSLGDVGSAFVNILDTAILAMSYGKPVEQMSDVFVAFCDIAGHVTADRRQEYCRTLDFATKKMVTDPYFKDLYWPFSVEH